MEKVTSWIWNDREDSYYFDPLPDIGGEKQGNVIVVRGKGKPEDSSEILPAALMMEGYIYKTRKKLTKHGKIMYDFLKTKGFNLT